MPCLMASLKIPCSEGASWGIPWTMHAWRCHPCIPQDANLAIPQDPFFFLFLRKERGCRWRAMTCINVTYNKFTKEKEKRMRREGSCYALWIVSSLNSRACYACMHGRINIRYIKNTCMRIYTGWIYELLWLRTRARARGGWERERDETEMQGIERARAGQSQKRERAREREQGRDSRRKRERECVCVCVGTHVIYLSCRTCVGKKERAQGRGSKRGIHRASDSDLCLVMEVESETSV